MSERQKLIGVCLTEAHSVLNTGFLSELNKAAAAEGYALVLFNSTPNAYRGEDGVTGSRAVYRSIQFSNFDAIVIIYYTLQDPQVLSEIVSGARRRHVPVISIGAEMQECYSFVNRYEDAYRDLLCHVISDHGARDTVYLAGRRNDSNSALRVDCYRRALESCGLPFEESRVYYADYSPDKAAEIVREFISGRDKMPDAVFCANDFMAIAVCDTLRENGIRVPEDVKVTGFDGTPSAYMVKPHLTTCCDDPPGLARETIHLVCSLKSGKRVPRMSYHHFRAVLSESCGCVSETNDRFDALTLFRRSERLNGHENDLYLKANILATEKDPEVFWDRLSRTLLPDSVLYVNKSFLDLFSGKEYSATGAEENIVAIPCRSGDEPLSFNPGLLKQIHPHGKKRTGVNIINAITVGNLYCGCYDVHTDDPEGDAQLIKRMSDVLCLLFTIQVGQARQQMLISDLGNTLYVDAATGLNNLRGLNRWYEAYSAETDNHSRPLSLSIYSINHYAYIYENYGMAEIESIISLVGARLKACNEEALLVARISEEQFVVVNSAENLQALGSSVDRAVSQFYRGIETHNAVSSKPYFIEVNCGCTTMDCGWENTALESLIHLALGEMYLNNMRSSSREVARSSKVSSSQYSTFNLLMEKNLLKFHFQPIVDARSGQISAYEALMRTDSLIQMTPLDILDVAREYNRLDEVERATVFGIIEHYVDHYSDFSGCRVFINTIPGHFLSAGDCAELKARFESYLNNFVFELTEQDTTPDDELDRLRSLCKAGSQTQIAIDDYGTGHSNMINVLRYAPQIIKVDRALISHIQDDSNKQLFVRNTIDFAHQNRIKVLAEGVETAEELRAVIDYGVDYIQGFFTGRPAERPLRAVSDTVRNIILEENLSIRRYNRSATVHTASDGEEIDVISLSVDGCACVQLTGGSATMVGIIKQTVDMSVHVADGAKASLTLRNVSLNSSGDPIISLGRDSELTLILEGESRFEKEGIFVPPTATLIIRGDGHLSIVNSRNYSIGIGANYNDPYGTIIVDMAGSLSIRSSGDRIVCMGGGRSAGEGIRLLRGSCSIQGNSITALGVGSTSGDARIGIGSEASLTILVEGNEAVGLGTISGEADIQSSGNLNITLNSERSVGAGTMGGSGQILLEGGRTAVLMHCDQGSCVGTFNGEMQVRVRDGALTVHGEGNRVAGFGSVSGACGTLIEGGHVTGDILAGENLLLGNEHSRVIITGGNVRLYPPEGQTPVSPGGHPLLYQEPREDHYEKSFRDKRESWVYKADRDTEGRLSVWIPAD